MSELLSCILKQLAVVFLIMTSLPLVITLLWKLRLLPLALYFVGTDLFFPKWAASHGRLCLCLFAASTLFAVLAWGFRIYRWKQEQRFYENLVLSRAKPLYRVTEDDEIVPVADWE